MEQIRIDIVPKGIMPVCHASQYDKGRVIRCNLMDGLQGYVLTTETIVLNVRKPDDNIVTAAVEVISGKTYVDIVTTEQMTACEGNNICELTMSKNDVVISTMNFKMQVEVDPLKDGIESETEIHNLTTQIQDINAEVVPPIVAEEVANQYDSANVIFDDHPTAGHGTGYVVKSENVPDELNDLNDVAIDSPASNQALVWDADNNRWTNGEVSTVGGLNDLNDVTLSDVQDKQELVYNGTDQVFKNKTTRIELTQAQYDALANPLPDVDYYITDAPSMQGTSADLSYDGTTKSTYTKIEEVASDVDTEKAANTASYLYKPTVTEPTLTNGSNYNHRTFYYKHGTRVWVYLGVSGLQTSSSYQTLFSLPTGYKPRVDIVVKMSGYAFANTTTIRILTNGEVRAENTQDEGAFGYIEFDAYS